MLGDLGSPAFLQASFLFNLEPDRTPRLLLISGASGCGKTRACLQWREQALAHGVQPVGLLSPAFFQNDLKAGIDLLDLSSGQTRRLATRRTSSSVNPGPLTEDWSFDAQTLAWGESLLAGLQQASLRRPHSWIMIDELGPLEFERGQGWQSGLRLVDECRYANAIVVVRPALLTTALERWPWAKPIYLEATRP